MQSTLIYRSQCSELLEANEDMYQGNCRMGQRVKDTEQLSRGVIHEPVEAQARDQSLHELIRERDEWRELKSDFAEVTKQRLATLKDLLQRDQQVLERLKEKVCADDRCNLGCCQEILPSRDPCIAVLQQQLRDSERQCEDSERARREKGELIHKLMQDKDRLCTNVQILQRKVRVDHERVTREKEQLNSSLDQLSRERNEFYTRLHQVARENEQLRLDLCEASRERETAVENLQHKDDRIQELSRRLEETHLGENERRTQLLCSLPSGDWWNVPRNEVIILREIGRGASGLVMEGRYQNQQVAVKQIHEGILMHPAVLRDFKREVRIMASIKHPNLVRFIAAVFDDDVENHDKTPLLVLELLHTDLRSACKNLESQQQMVLIFRDVAYGLHYLHEHQQPIIHRDVSAPNVLLESLHGTGAVWRAKLSDFGSANYLRQAKSYGVGALPYTAPEMFPPPDPQAPMPRPTTKCDVFSYGMLIVEVVTKTMPTPDIRPRLFNEVRTKWPSMYDLATQCTEISPNNRPTMADVLNSLNRIPIARPRNRSLPSQSSVERSSLNSSLTGNYL